MLAIRWTKAQKGLIGSLLALGLLGAAAASVPIVSTAAAPESAPPTMSVSDATDHPAGAKNEPSVKLDTLGDPLPPGAVMRLGTTRFRHPGEIKPLSCSADGKCVATGGDVSGKSDLVRLWDIDSGKELFACAGHNGRVYSVAYSGDNKTVASVGEDGTLRR